ncbi:MAG TPA: ABC transporter permease [Candidatus Binatia bacterium]|nr:ABC transporter permease [Candidatus Binatia bacterium]
MTSVAIERPAVRTRAPRRIWRTIGHWALPVFTGLVVLYLMVPIIVMIIFSFNDYQGKFNYVWNAFTLNGWLHPLDWPGLGDAIRTSLVIAFVSTVIATALGTLIGLALVRYEFRGRGAVNGLIFLPMATPEIVLGASLLTMFVASASQSPLKNIIPSGTLFPLGMQTILIAHIMFNISYVVVTVKARLIGFDRRLEEAAMDLGANEWTTFWRVTFPIILPGVVAAGLLAFSLSIDDFIITNLVSGPTVNTFPIWVYSIQRNALPVQINVIGSIVFLSAVGFVAVSNVISARRAR